MADPLTGLTATEVVALNAFRGAVWTTDIDLRFTAVCGGLLTAAGIDPGTVVGRTVAEWYGTEDPAHPHVAGHARALRGETVHLHTLGLGRDLNVRLEPLRDGDHVVGVVGLAVEVVGDEGVAAQFERRIAQQQAAAELGLAAIGSTDIDELYRLATETVASQLGAAGAAVIEVGPGDQELHVRTMRVDDEYRPPHPVAVEGSIVLLALELGGPAVTGARSSDERLAPADHPFESGIAVPISSRVGAVGALTAFSRERYAFSETDVFFVSTVANILAGAIERANAEAFAATAIEMLPDAIAVIDDEGTILQVNAAGERLRGVDRSQIVGQRTLWFSSLEQYLSGEVREADFTRPDGETRRILFYGTPNVQPGRHLVVARDVTDQRRLERELREAQRMEAVGQLAAGIAHDFNNLLVAVRGLSAIVRDELPPGSELRTDVETIHAAGERGIEIVNRLLAFARPLLPEDAEVVSPTSLVEGVQLLLRQSLPEDVTLEATASTVANVLVHAADLEQAVINLVLNARDAITGVGSVWIALDDAVLGSHEAEVLGLAPDRYVRISVTDDGVGMDEATRARAADPFFTTKEAGRGTGLGLAMVARLAALAGGALEIDSAPGIGSTVALYLPVVDAMPVPRLEESGSAQGGDETVLVVDDDPAALRFAARALTRLGYDVIPAETGADALVAAAARPDVAAAVLDVVMPAEGGRKLATRLRAERPDLPICFVSGYSNGPQDDILAKPYTELELGRAVRCAIDGA